MSRGYCGQCGGLYSDQMPCECQRRTEMNKTFRELEQKRNHLIDVIRASEIFDEEPSDFIKGLCGELEKIIKEINLREEEQA